MQRAPATKATPPTTTTTTTGALTPPAFAPISTPARPLTPTRALTSSLPPTTTPPAVQRQAPQPAVPLRRPTRTAGRPTSPGTGPAVQRLTADKPPSRTAIPLTVAPTTPPQTPQAPRRPSALPARTALQRQATNTAPSPAPVTPHAPTPPLPTPTPTPAPIQRAPEIPLRPTAATTTTAVSPVTATAATTPHRTASADPPPPYSATASADPPPPYSAVDNHPSSGAPFDPRALTDFQLDELTHKLIGRITRLVRTELRLDRERIGKLRDPRH
ncbi:extensin [Streptomyces sp. CA-210063]|uniref:extensin n=1 Tax=Streptomyces sp. CA-210063 TaxID=2801029 RepID=UPI00214CD328|nr:extensin [Streptomyces sp. CA-210063]UUU30764.1 extensin [Streptomyces sp. CA-210063]